jgi:hypothetical protein
MPRLAPRPLATLATQAAYGTEGGLRLIFDHSDRPFQFREGHAGEGVPNGPLVVMNGNAAGWVRLYLPAVERGMDWRHGREGKGVSIVLDVVPTQDKGVGQAGRGGCEVQVLGM